MQQRARQLVGRVVAKLGQPRQCRPAGVAQAEQLGGLVEGLAGRVVDGFAQQLVAAHAIDAHQLRVAAADQQGDEGKFGWIGAEEGRQQVPLQVVHAQHRLAQRRTQRAGHAGAHQQRTRQAGAARVSYYIDSCQRLPRLRQHVIGQWNHAADVVTAGQLGHHAAVVGMHRHLGVQRVRQQLGHAVFTRAHQRHAGFVAGRFDTENQGRHGAGLSAAARRTVRPGALCAG